MDRFISQGIRSAAAAARVSNDDELSDSSQGGGGQLAEAYPEVGHWLSPPTPKVPPPAPPTSMPLPQQQQRAAAGATQQQQRAPADATQNPWSDFRDVSNDPLRHIPWQQRETLASTKDRCLGFKKDRSSQERIAECTQMQRHTEKAKPQAGVRCIAQPCRSLVHTAGVLDRLSRSTCRHHIRPQAL